MTRSTIILVTRLTAFATIAWLIGDATLILPVAFLLPNCTCCPALCGACTTGPPSQIQIVVSGTVANGTTNSPTGCIGCIDCADDAGTFTLDRIADLTYTIGLTSYNACVWCVTPVGSAKCYDPFAPPCTLLSSQSARLSMIYDAQQYANILFQTSTPAVCAASSLVTGAGDRQFVAATESTDSAAWSFSLTGGSQTGHCDYTGATATVTAL